VTFLTAGGGGYGEPKQRAAEAVKRDVAEGVISVEAAMKLYGASVAKQPAE
jgi:N-methylhydantoinase B